MQEGIHHRSRPIPRCRMHDEAGLLIEHQEIGVFVENLKGNRLRPQIQRLGARHLQPDSITRLDLLTRPDGLPVDLNASFSDQPLQGRAGKGRVAIGEKNVDPFGRFPSGDNNLNRSGDDSIHVGLA